MKNNIVRIISLVAVGLSVLSCQTQPREPLRNRPELQPINSVRVGDFKCDNEVIGQAVRNVFMELIADYADAKVVREGEADVVIEGTVTLAQGDSSSVGIGGGASAIFGKGASVAGGYVSGVTAVALRNGEIITSASWGQVFGKGKELLPPESVAHETAHRLAHKLFDEGLKKR